MTSARPIVQHQGPACSCNIDGLCVGWLSCSAYAMAMGIDKSSLGIHTPSGCTVRRYTGDKSGGLTLPQVAAVASNQYHLPVEVHTGSNVARPAYVLAECRKGRGFLLQGNTKALLGTPNQSTAGGVNHAVWVNEIRANGDALVFDPAADGRKRGYFVDTSPSWWPWKRVEAFAAALRPWGDGDPRTLGAGWMYVGLMSDTEPHVLLRFGARRTRPFPDRTRAHGPAHVHSSPTTGKASVVGSLTDGDLYIAYQVTTKGESFEGSRTWYGDVNGKRWVNSRRLSHEGGST